MADLVNFELCNDNLEQFNQAWEETLLSLDNTVDEEMLKITREVFPYEKRFEVVSFCHSSEERTQELQPIATTSCEGNVVNIIPHEI